MDSSIGKPRYYLEIIFKFLFLTYTMLSFCNFTYGTKIISLIMWPTILLGLFLVLLRIKVNQFYQKMPLLMILICLLAVYLFSAIYNFQYGLKQNIITFIFWLFYFFLLYTNDIRLSRETIRKEFNLFSGFFLLYMFSLVSLSLYLMYVGYSKVYVTDTNYEVAFGFIWGRLWGAFIDPNAAAVMATMSILLSIYFIKNLNRKIPLKWILAINIVMQTVYIAFTDSRSGKLSFSISLGLFVAFALWKKIRHNNPGLKLITLLGVIMISSCVFYACPGVIKSAYNSYAQKVAASAEKSTSQFSNTTDKDNGGTPARSQITRGYDLSTDISNRRFDIWKSGIEIYSTSPLFGTTFGGLLQYTEDHLPNTYLVNNDYKKFSTLDNEFLNILVSLGSFGFLLLLVLIFSALIYIWIRLFKKQAYKEYDIISTLFCCLIALAISSIFRATMFFHSSPNANLFWMFLGYVIILLKKTELIYCKNKTRNLL